MTFSDALSCLVKRATERGRHVVVVVVVVVAVCGTVAVREVAGGMGGRFS